MGEDAIAEDVKVFLLEHIESVLQLEILLLLRADPQRAWTHDDVARELRMEPTWAAGHLETLASRGLLARDNETYRYAPAKPANNNLVARLADAYANYRVTIIGLIFSRPSATLKSFADAFRFRKDKPDG